MKFLPCRGGGFGFETVLFLCRRRFAVFRSLVKVFRSFVKVFRSGLKRFRRRLKSIRREFYLFRSLLKVFRRLIDLFRRFLATKKVTWRHSNRGLHHSKRAEEEIIAPDEHCFESSACLLLPRKCGNECRKGLVTVVAGLLIPNSEFQTAHPRS